MKRLWQLALLALVLASSAFSMTVTVVEDKGGYQTNIEQVDDGLSMAALKRKISTYIDTAGKSFFLLGSDTPLDNSRILKDVKDAAYGMELIRPGANLLLILK